LVESCKVTTLVNIDWRPQLLATFKIPGDIFTQLKGRHTGRKMLVKLLVSTFQPRSKVG